MQAVNEALTEPSDGPDRSGAVQAADADSALMLEVKAGDAAAFEELVRRHQGRLLRFFYNLVDTPHQAEDLVQEVFLRVFRARTSYRPQAKFSTWIYRIASNVASNARRSRRRRREYAWGQTSPSGRYQSLEQLLEATTGMMPARRLDKAERADMVRRALETLGQRQRMAVLLAKFEGMSYAEIGRALGASPKAVKSLLARARVQLRQVLEPYLSQGELPGTSGKKT